MNSSVKSQILESRGELIKDGVMIGSMAQTFFRKPKSLNGGGKSFWGFNPLSNKNYDWQLHYSIEIVHKNLLNINCIGEEMGIDGKRPIMVTVVVTPSSMNTKIIN